MVALLAVISRRLSLSLPEGYWCYLQDVTGKVDLREALLSYWRGEREGEPSEVYLSSKLVRVQFRPSRRERAVLHSVTGSGLTRSIEQHARLRGVTIRNVIRGIW